MDSERIIHDGYRGYWQRIVFVSSYLNSLMSEAFNRADGKVQHIKSFMPVSASVIMELYKSRP
jgi:hypothetical protein